ncbi:hypothetical protein IE077_003568, partial [Cardiosporidium cionae]
GLTRLICVYPQYILTNHLDVFVEIRPTGSQRVSCSAQPRESIPIDWIQKIENPAFEFRVGGFSNWSSTVIACEETVGCVWMAVEDSADSTRSVYGVTISIVDGLRSIVLTKPTEESSGFILVNNCLDVGIVHLITTHNISPLINDNSADIIGCCFSASYGESIHFGWKHPHVYSSRWCCIEPEIAGICRYFDCSISLSADKIISIDATKFLRMTNRGNKRIIEVLSKEITTVQELNHSLFGGESSVECSVVLAQVGLSFLSENLHEEILYSELLHLKINFKQVGESQELKLTLADIQVDSQMENTSMPVLLACRKNSLEEEKKRSFSYFERDQFITLFIERLYTSSDDFIIKNLQLKVAHCEISLDDEMLNGLNVHVARWIESPFHIQFSPPPLSQVLVIQNLEITECYIVAWCSFLLARMHMMSDLFKFGLNLVMASDTLELKGAPFVFSEVIIQNIRVSVPSFLLNLKDNYTQNALTSVFKVLGHSSLLNIPRLPVHLGRQTIGATAGLLENMTSSFGGVMSSLTFDANYIKTRQKERVRNNLSMKDEFLCASKNLGEGVLALTSFVTQPIAGAKNDGVSGFFKGVGKGLVGSLVKPLDKVGQAITDVSRGIQAGISENVTTVKERTRRRREPRMLWGEMGEIRDYHIYEAELRRKLGLELVKNILKCITIHRTQYEHTLLLFYPRTISYVSLRSHMDATTSSKEESITINKIWDIPISSIVDIHATTHGILFRLTQEYIQLPNDSAPTIRLIYNEIAASQRRIRGTLKVGKIGE